MRRLKLSCATVWIVAAFGACTPIATEDSDASEAADAPVDATNDGAAVDGGDIDIGRVDDALDSAAPDRAVTDGNIADDGATVSDVAPRDSATDLPSTPDTSPRDGAADLPSTPDTSLPDAAMDAPTPDAAAPDAAALDAAALDAAVLDAAAHDTAALDAPTPDAPTPDAPTLDVTARDVSTDSGLPPIDAFAGALPLPTRAPATWGPWRITTRGATDAGLAPVQRLVYGYSARRVNYVDTERWSGAAWVPYERSTYAYTIAGAIDARFVYRHTSGWTEFQRWRFEYNADGTLRAQHGDVRNGAAWGELTQITWEWAGGLPAWQRYYTAASVGAASAKLWENTYEYDASGRFTSVWRIERTRPTDTFRLAGRRTPTVRATGHVDRETFTLPGVTSERVYRYDAAGALLEVADAATADRYLYDARGHLEFVRTYTALDGAWSLATEVQIEGADEGGDLTWALDPEPHETWRRDLYGRGNIVDRYRR